MENNITSLLLSQVESYINVLEVYIESEESSHRPDYDFIDQLKLNLVSAREASRLAGGRYS